MAVMVMVSLEIVKSRDRMLIYFAASANVVVGISNPPVSYKLFELNRIVQLFFGNKAVFP